MEIRIKTSGYDMPLDVAAYLDGKMDMIAKLVGDDETARCEVEIGRAVGHSQQGNVWKAEITMMLEGERLRALAMEESVNAAIDIAKDEIMQQLRKNKGRHTTLARRVGAKIKRWTRFGRG